MRYLLPFLLAVTACSKSPTPEPAKPEPTKPEPTKPEPAKPEPAKPEPAKPEPAKPEPAKPEPEAAAADAYLVWTAKGEAYESVLLEGGKPATTRAQAAVYAGGTLWALEYRYYPFRERACDFDDPEAKNSKPGPKKYLPWLVAKGLVGDSANNELVLADKPGDYIEAGTDEGSLIGEHNGRGIVLSGGAAELLLVTDCEGAYACGAHGDWGCSFKTEGMDGAKVELDLDAITTAIEPETKSMREAWAKDMEEWGAATPKVQQISLLANKGEPKASYTLVADVPYVATAGDWSAYTQSKDYVGAIVPALHVPATPPDVLAYLKGASVEGAFGWSLVPKDEVAKVKAALLDASTLPAPKPADETAAPVGEDAGALVDQGRKLTNDKKLTEAIAMFDKAIGLEPKRARAFSGRGYAKLLSGDLDGAKQDFETALGLDDKPKFQAAIYFNLGELAEKQKDTKAALAAYMKADSLSPSDAAKKRIEKLSK